MFFRRNTFSRLALPAALFAAVAAPLIGQDAGASRVADAGNIPASMPAHPGGLPGGAITTPVATQRTLDPDGPASLDLADSLVARGRFLAAIHVYTRLQPVTANIQNRMGVASERMLMFDQAQHCFEAALQMDPGMGEAWNNLGTVMHTRGELGKAEKFYKKAIKLKPDGADAYQNLGALYYSNRKYKKGDAMYRKAMDLDPSVMERTAQRGIQAIGSGKNQAEMHYHLACTFAKNGSTRLAMDYLRRSVVEGFHDRNRLLHDESFADLRTSEPFLHLVDDLKHN